MSLNAARVTLPIKPRTYNARIQRQVATIIYGCEKVERAFIVTGFKAPELFKFIEEALIGFSLPINKTAESKSVLAVCLGVNIGLGFAFLSLHTQSVVIIGFFSSKVQILFHFASFSS
jgi:hypothetical protein